MDSLLKIATQVLSSKAQRQSMFVAWLTDTKLLVQEWPMIKGHNWNNPFFRLVALELLTGKRTQQGTTSHRVFFGNISPDRQWILLRNHDLWPDELQVVSLGNGSPRHWTLANAQKDHNLIVASRSPLWISGGRAWVMLVFRQNPEQHPQLYALHGRLNQPGKIIPLPLGESNDATGGYPCGWAEISSAHLVTSPDGDLIYGLHSAGTKDGVQLWRWEFRLSQGKRSRREFKLPFPKNEGVKAVAYHPGNQRLAVLTTQTSDQWFIHTMRLDGSERVCLGTVTARHRLEKLEWLPSGKKLSFLHEGALWVVPDAPPQKPQLV